jgi:hypothetical protein
VHHYTWLFLFFYEEVVARMKWKESTSQETLNLGEKRSCVFTSPQDKDAVAVPWVMVEGGSK